MILYKCGFCTLVCGWLEFLAHEFDYFLLSCRYYKEVCGRTVYIHQNSEAFEQSVESFEILSIIRKDVKYNEVMPNFPTRVGKITCELLKRLDLPDGLIYLP